MKKTNIAIIGVGLIGGSLGMALKKSGKFRVIGIGRHIEKLKLAKRLNAVDEYTTDFFKGVSTADIVIICTPVDLIARTLKNILPFVKKSAIITDVGSVKGAIIDRINAILKTKTARERKITFVGAHPMAGAEKAGVENASKDLFRKSTVAIIKESNMQLSSFRAVKEIWKIAGAEIKIMSSREHDSSVALISHLPHVIAFSLCQNVGSLKNTDTVSALLAGSFKDITRVADSNPRDWAAICNMNKQEVKKAIDLLVKTLLQAKNKLGDMKALEKIFSKAKISRQKLLRA